MRPLRQFFRALHGTALLLLIGLDAHAAMFFVDGANPASSDSNPGTAHAPYRTISAAIAAHNGPGVTIHVMPAAYNESVANLRSGDATNPFVLEADRSGVVKILNLYVSGRSWIVIDGLAVTRGAFVGTSRGVTLSHNRIVNLDSLTIANGLYVTQCEELSILSNTISGWSTNAIVFRDVSHSVLEGNEVSHNLNDGLEMFSLAGSRANVIRYNQFFGNGGTALDASYDFDNVAIQNVMYANKHGIQHVHSSNFVHVGDVVWGNTDDGIWLKNSATGIVFENCIIADNGAGRSTAYNILMDSTSAFPVSNDNVFSYAKTGRFVKAGIGFYPTLAAWTSVTGGDTRSVAKDPAFVDASHGDFHLRAGSPAIDCANTGVADWPAMDSEHRAPLDDPATPNTGLGPVSYADRGAFEYVPATLAVDGFRGPSGAGVELGPVAPNPMHQSGRVEYTVTTATRVRLTILDLQGRTVGTLMDREQSPGRHAVDWDGRANGRAMSAGVYFLRITDANGVATRRFALLE